MSFSLQVASGDFVMVGSQLGIVYGVNKLKQDLALWFIERYGIDKSHPTMGSYFEYYIGGMINSTTQSLIYNEAMRILNNYQSVQGQAFAQSPQLFSLSELLYSIQSVNVTLAYDAVTAAVSVTNAEQQTTTVTTTTTA